MATNSSSKTSFAKPAASAEDLLEKLVNVHGLTFPANERQTALNYLRHVGAYRLKGYWFQKADPISKRFPAGFTFKSIQDRYEFDKELRALTAAAIETVEVSVRCAIANYLSSKHTPHWFLDPKIFKPIKEWGIGNLIRKIEEEVFRSSEKVFIAHYFSNHDDPYLPPSWAVSECVTFGFWSRTYQILRDNNDQKAIAMKFKVAEPDVFRSWIHTTTVIRNLVAHHGRLLGVKLGVSPSNYKSAKIKFSDNKSFFAAATVINYLLMQTGLPQQWKGDLLNLFAKYSASISPSEIGFPNNWDQLPGW